MAPGPGAGPAGEEAWTLRRLAGRVVSRLSTRWGQPAPATGPAPRHQGDSAAADAASTSTYSLPAHRHPRSVVAASDHNTTDSSYSASTTDSVEDDEEEDEEEEEAEAEAEAGAGPERGAQQTLGRGRRQASSAPAPPRPRRRATLRRPPRPPPPSYAAGRAVAAAAAGSSAVRDDQATGDGAAAPCRRRRQPPAWRSAHLPYVLHQRARPRRAAPSFRRWRRSPVGGRGRRWRSVPQPQPLHEEPSRALCAAYASHAALPHVLHSEPTIDPAFCAGRLGAFGRIQQTADGVDDSEKACEDNGVLAGSGFRQLCGDLRGPPGLRRVVLGMNFFLPHVHLVIFAAASCLHAPDG
ncbi:Protein of unknown function [Gryllus bimaculatus]|nr:Protein of unknown function [Gryllus bimaculatus]